MSTSDYPTRLRDIHPKRGPFIPAATMCPVCFLTEARVICRCGADKLDLSLKRIEAERIRNNSTGE